MKPFPGREEISNLAKASSNYANIKEKEATENKTLVQKPRRFYKGDYHD